jgi:hypothetical protein
MHSCVMLNGYTICSRYIYVSELAYQKNSDVNASAMLGFRKLVDRNILE